MNQDTIIKQITTDLLESFTFFADSNYTGYDPLHPVSKIVFAAQGEITTPPDLGFMGYGGGSEGEAFSDCGVLDLEVFFPLNEEGDYYREDNHEYKEKCFHNACQAVLQGLTAIAKSDKFQKIPKEGPVVFVLNLIDQFNKVLCRIHPDGEVELPPKKE
ncbi:hypothetical protein [Aquimarina spinulae]|uniref:hypothetical protein n=1 Tax=Aquimarina spinulae TaxID=1192023 RepID=UPI000D553E16|nr:hypothetical protein [Aquimarina spinulae]